MIQNATIENQKKESISYLDFLRLIAISAVILLHVISGVSDTIPEQMTVTQLNIYRTILSFCTIGVPLFFMISGTLFLAPQKQLSLKNLFQKYLRRIVLALVLFGSFYALLELIMVNKTFAISYLGTAFFNMLSGNSWAHMWYLYALIGLYLFLPLFKAFCAQADAQTYRYLLILLFVIGSILPFLETVFHFKLGFIFPTVGIYLFYYLCGYYLHSYAPKNPSAHKIAICILIASILVILCGNIAKLNLDFSYDSPFVVLMSLSIFYLASYSKKNWTFCFRLRDYYFGMYLVHTVFLNLAYKLFHVTPLLLGGYILIPVFFMGTFLLSLLTAWIMKKLPLLGKYVV